MPGCRALAEATSNYRWLIANRLGAPALRQKTAPDGEALLYYQCALEAELAKVRLEVARIGVPSPPFEDQGDAADIAVRI